MIQIPTKSYRRVYHLYWAQRCEDCEAIILIFAINTTSKSWTWCPSGKNTEQFIFSSFRHVVSRNPGLAVFWIPANYMPEWRWSKSCTNKRNFVFPIYRHSSHETPSPHTKKNLFNQVVYSDGKVIVHRRPIRSLAGSLTCTRPTEVPLGYDQSGLALWKQLELTTILWTFEPLNR